MAKKKKNWTTKDGTKIPIKEMTTMHIMHVIDLFEHTGTRKQQIKWLKEERAIRLGLNVKIPDEPVKNRWSILDLRKDDNDFNL